MTILGKKLIHPGEIKQEYLTVTSFNGMTMKLTLTGIELEVGGKKLCLEVAVHEGLMYVALLAQDFPFLWNLGDQR